MIESAYLSSGTFQNGIEEESQDINTLLQSAKSGQWDNVWEMIGTPEQPKKAYLINSIPEKRHWGILHQTIYWKDTNILQTLLKFSACDSRLKTKELSLATGMTALELARKYGFNEGEKILSMHQCNFKEENEELDVFQPWRANVGLKEFGLLPITLAAYKNTFHPNKIDPEKSVVSVLGDIFNDLNTSENRWQEVRDKVSESLCVVNVESASRIKTCTSRQELYKSIINAYTEESTYLYAYVNTALRRQQESDYKPSAEDLAMGPYVVMFQILLLFWGELKRENAKTYRKMLMSGKDMAKYQVGVEFKWLSFVSSSAEFQKARSCPTCGAKSEYSITFTIDNTTDSIYQPRDIAKYARYMERERVYPAGAKFVVTNRLRQNGETHVTLKLLSS